METAWACDGPIWPQMDDHYKEDVSPEEMQKRFNKYVYQVTNTIWNDIAENNSSLFIMIGIQILKL
jgi:hypothetical protein